MELHEILKSLQTGKISLKKAQKLLSLYSIEKIEDFAKIDVGRKRRKGIPEVVFAETKTIDEIKKIIKSIMKKSNNIVVSRIQKNDLNKIIKFVEKLNYKVKTGKNCSSILIYKKPIRNENGKIGIITAGTSDIGVAEEARLMSESMNCKCVVSYDVGIAGIHRVFPTLKEFISNDIDVIIVVAGMEGALASLVSSMTDIPVIGVPTSVGYGYGKDGIAALASMLQSCSMGISVVNVDNGIAAGAIAANIANRRTRK
ncbi:MAG: nickel pincer cofactor biosynthesis protein LarB [Nitrosopumilaceae archaeon]|nr:nickel pincer cofactor biosynthesis protein LarB [Nitrosopumilaceae archaeon]NIU00519.1 nickel pincer cofactor biosynthesis protein LarB [Nitrosopumilaceae archaeon]NIU86902.1 nickel pincer cofactor biosynthesis protein LarB [Nitrosopumilaceae archaeon]NIV65582.1 nickel pincer cofactor biosynthesis protein LarB [Nitrosopumilaceae archaeon]NIX61121.1 nickel pincer cofactor biosynthesis protein LarB [Nitrosopumilaceae archaeon]